MGGNGAAPAADVQVPLMSLPRMFGTRVASIPAAVPYVFADALLRAKWRRAFSRDAAVADAASVGAAMPTLAASATAPSRLNGVRVGIVWQGNPKLPGDAFRSVKLERFAPLAAVPGVRLYSLQKGTGSEQVAALAGRFAVTDLAAHLAMDFRDTAAALDCLDLVIAVDTSVAHLAGALGKPVWVLLPINPDWRWQRDGETSAVVSDGPPVPPAPLRRLGRGVRARRGGIGGGTVVTAPGSQRGVSVCCRHCRHRLAAGGRRGVAQKHAIRGTGSEPPRRRVRSNRPEFERRLLRSGGPIRSNPGRPRVACHLVKRPCNARSAQRLRRFWCFRFKMAHAHEMRETMRRFERQP